MFSTMEKETVNFIDLFFFPPLPEQNMCVGCVQPGRLCLATVATDTLSSSCSWYRVYCYGLTNAGRFWCRTWCGGMGNMRTRISDILTLWWAVLSKFFYKYHCLSGGSPRGDMMSGIRPTSG